MGDSAKKYYEQFEENAAIAQKKPKWVHTTAKFWKDNPGDPGGDKIEEIGLYSFRMKWVTAFNLAEDDIHTTVDLVNGYRTTIAIKHADFCKMIDPDYDH